MAASMNQMQSRTTTYGLEFANIQDGDISTTKPQYVNPGEVWVYFPPGGFSGGQNQPINSDNAVWIRFVSSDVRAVYAGQYPGRVVFHRDAVTPILTQTADPQGKFVLLPENLQYSNISANYVTVPVEAVLLSSQSQTAQNAPVLGHIVVHHTLQPTNQNLQMRNAPVLGHIVVHHTLQPNNQNLQMRNTPVLGHIVVQHRSQPNNQNLQIRNAPIQPRN